MRRRTTRSRETRSDTRSWGQESYREGGRYKAKEGTMHFPDDARQKDAKRRE